ncbi:MAG TPA: excinuclease ABC subunit UvrC, partial [Permianibacter sp.]|nr:excinuclease ABC subunit UvrC [Permianibacter sp.]
MTDSIPATTVTEKGLLIHEPERLAETLKLLSTEPGVYRMLAGSGEVLYVGKAKNLKKRVSSYFRREHDSIKTEVLVGQIADIHVTLTHSESEALVLEYNLIQEFQPRFNILLRDDKSYPYVFLSGETYPRLAIHRGPRKEKGRYFGPFPSAGAVRQSLLLLQKLFHVRQCENSYFANRTRPCLQYQIGRCTAPCVGYVTPEEYDRDVRLTAMFYEGRNQDVIAELAKQMEQAAGELQFEKAAQLRDQIAQLRRVLDRQRVSADSGDVDVVAGVIEKGLACVYVLYVR